jgi:carboxyl-terminal processing protease
MNKKVQIWLPLVFSVAMIAGMFIGYRLRDNMPPGKNLLQKNRKSSMQEVLDLVRMKYVDPVNTDTLSDEAIQQVLAHLDPHSVYISASELSEVNEDLQGNFEGIGVEFNIFSDTVHVLNIVPGGPSDKAGLQAGDRFLRVGDTVVTGSRINSELIRKLLRGPRGSDVKVTLLRGKEQKQVTIRRGTIPIPSVDAVYMINKTAGYIRINKFAETTYEEFMEGIEQLKKNGMQQLLLDLRDNGGGLLDEAVEIADEMLDGNKLIVTVKGNGSPAQERRCKREGVFERGKVVLLVDENSASASEVLAGALQDHDRATIVGQRSFGKGLVQEQYDLTDGGALRLTVARYYTPSGRSIQKPYDKGLRAYNDELRRRYQDGSMVNADSNKVSKGQAYHTDAGRTVYGGGGIMPDVFVPSDTTKYDRKLYPLFAKNTLSNFAYTYATGNAALQQQYKTPAAFATGFVVNEILWKNFTAFAATDSIDLSGISGKDKTRLAETVKMMIARQIWRTNGYFEVRNASDPMFAKAVEEMGK